MTDQLALFDPPPTGRPITFVQMCHLCGQPVSAVPLDDVRKPWLPPVLWCYLAQKRHEREHHPSDENSPPKPIDKPV